VVHDAYRLLRHHLGDGDPMANQLTGAGSDEMAAHCRPETTSVDFSLQFACWLHRAGLHFSWKRTRTVTRAADGEMKSDPAPLLGFPCPSWPPFFPFFFSASLGFFGAVFAALAAIHAATPLDKTRLQLPTSNQRKWLGVAKMAADNIFPPKKKTVARSSKTCRIPRQVGHVAAVCVCVRVYFYLLLFKVESSFVAKLKHVDCDV